MDTFKSHGIVRNEYNLTPVSSHLTNELLIHVVTREKKDLHFHMFNANIFVLLLNDFHEWILYESLDSYESTWILDAEIVNILILATMFIQ